MKLLNPMNNTYVIEYYGKIVATAKLCIELKLHNNFAQMALIEDVVVSEECRGMGFGKNITDVLVQRAKAEKCYKIVLNCSKDNIPFYEKCNFKQKGMEMTMYL